MLVNSRENVQKHTCLTCMVVTIMTGIPFMYVHRFGVDIRHDIPISGYSCMAIVILYNAK